MLAARAYHAPETLEQNDGVATEEEEEAYYANLIAGFDQGIARKNSKA